MIDDIKNSLNEFKQNCMSHLDLYDALVRIPYWRDNAFQEKDFLRETLGIFAKIYAHYHMIQNPNALIKDDEYNTKMVSSLSDRLIGNINSIKDQIQHHPELNGSGLCDSIIEETQQLKGSAPRPSLR
jgi:hypothetical protein